MHILNTNTSIFFIPKGPHAAICVNTNGKTCHNGNASMKTKFAKQADKFFNISPMLGWMIREQGNHCYDMGLKALSGHAFHVIAFPTKKNKSNSSDLDRIIQSCYELVEIVNEKDFDEVYLLNPCCNFNYIEWKTHIKPLIESILDDRFTIVIND